jgi:hypothetical protein
MCHFFYTCPAVSHAPFRAVLPNTSSGRAHLAAACCSRMPMHTHARRLRTAGCPLRDPPWRLGGPSLRPPPTFEHLKRPGSSRRQVSMALTAFVMAAASPFSLQ